ncbi:DUF2809 domain-containing protein [Sphingomonas sp. HF-S4]|uniref:DUF2809 domain-containing protein n=1 Tax=Sphingomonas agrestis TaxID=3080540 RepID=A0ABU3Y651_9SPHN|nr:DUF2809 domain-containing protein [Sphingomonas sp. HF-S4]MDV3456812.1 DUF2809 domain-containing protein [Sphingomonas sp. HF-S4]
MMRAGNDFQAGRQPSDTSPGEDMRLHRGYALLALALFLIEVGIALFVRDRFVRPYLGDTLAVILVYATLRAGFRIDVLRAVAIALSIAVTIELAQLIRLLDMLGLEHNRIARIVLGYGFELKDLAAYAAGALLVVAAERWRAAM